MKEYLAPEFEKFEYEAEDCLTGSQGVNSETEDIGDIINNLY